MEQPPATSGIGLANWYWKVVRQFVAERFGISLSRSSCLTWLHRLGFAFKRPKKLLLKADQAKREAFLVEYAELGEEAGRSEARIFFADEAHFRADAELRGKWVPKGQPAADMLTVIAMAGMQTQRIELGTAVVPTYPRHPVALAQQALTAQVAVGGRLTLGIGVSHRSTVEDWLGLPYAHPARHMEEYLSVLRPLLQESGVDFQGREFRVTAELQIPDADMVSCPVVMAALGPRMLEIAGRLADGTVTWMTGPNTLRDHVVPRLQESAEAAGNPPPRVCVGLPVAVTDRPDRARDRANRLFQHYAVLPSYRAMLEREGVEGPGGVAIVGSEAAVEAQLRHLAELGATDFLATIFPVDGSQTSVTRTRALLQGLVGRI